MNIFNKRLFVLLVQLCSVITIGFSQDMVQTNPNSDVKFDLGIATYAFRNKSFKNVLASAKKMGIKKLTVKNMHVPFDVSNDDLQNIKKEAGEVGVDIYAGGVIYMKTLDEVKQAFDYAKRVGMKMIVGVPNPELLDVCEQLVREYDIQLAIHNHGARDILYPSPESVMELIKDRDKRIGLCVDVGHTLRLNIDPAEEIRKYEDRVLDVQIWDVSSATHEGKAIMPGYGVLNFKEILEALIDIEYAGTVSIEYWTDPEHPEIGTAYTLGYIYGILNTLPQKQKDEDNQLSIEEKNEGWKLLFNGKTTLGWRGINQKTFPNSGWVVENGQLCIKPISGASSGAGDIITTEKYSNFELVWEWKMLTQGGNSGLKYFVEEGISNNKGYGYGLEYQILDDVNHSWMIEGKMKPGDFHTVGALYELFEPTNKKLKPLGEYNISRILVNNNHVEHWLNGVKVLEYERGGKLFNEKVKKSKFANVKGYGLAKEGHILLQDHGSEVHFKNIKIRNLGN